MAKLDSLSHDFTACLASFTTFALTVLVGALVSGWMSHAAQARTWAPPDVTWTQTLHEEVKVAVERFQGRPGDNPDWIAAHCGRQAIGTSNCPRH